ncbi:MAG: methyltransferase [Ectothiorhodospiraceae bacterium]|nr:methyltransferase [Ectothiorhodospiraceae bacterium]
MKILPDELTSYLESLLPERDANFYRMEERAKADGFPIIGPLVGNYLAQLAASISAKNIMELGSGFGYSALWFSTVLPEDGSIICTDGDPANRSHAIDMFDTLDKSALITFHTGDALTVFKEQEDEFDLIFCDIDKHEYPQAFEAAFPKLRSGGILAFDNALWSGRMLEGDAVDSTKGVVELNRRAFSEKGCQASIIPIRDGVLVCRKT